ncbi:MAG: hypothetical protein U0165_09840 [Polyangiaceae bacterium]
MSSSVHLGGFVFGAVIAFAACGGDADPSKPTSASTASSSQPASTASGASTAATSASSTATSKAPPAASASASSSAASIAKPLADDCKTPRVLVATQPIDTKANSADDWVLVRQAMLVTPDFKVVGKPSKSGEVAFKNADLGADKKNRALIAECADAATCNKLAAAVKKLVPSSSPIASCGEPPNTSGGTAVTFASSGAAGDLPKANDTRAQCARLAACMLSSSTPPSGDPANECITAPSKAKTSCASKLTCDEVLKCAK